MKLEEVLGYIPKEELEKLSLIYNVDHQVKKATRADYVSAVALFHAECQA